MFSGRNYECVPFEKCGHRRAPHGAASPRPPRHCFAAPPTVSRIHRLHLWGFLIVHLPQLLTRLQWKLLLLLFLLMSMHFPLQHLLKQISQLLMERIHCKGCKLQVLILSISLVSLLLNLLRSAALLADSPTGSPPTGGNSSDSGDGEEEVVRQIIASNDTFDLPGIPATEADCDEVVAILAHSPLILVMVEKRGSGPLQKFRSYT